MAFSKTIATCRDRRGWERYLRENGNVAQDGYRVIGSRVCWHGFANNGVGSRRRWWRRWRRWPWRRWRHGRGRVWGGRVGGGGRSRGGGWWGVRERGVSRGGGWG